MMSLLLCRIGSCHSVCLKYRDFPKDFMLVYVYIGLATDCALNNNYCTVQRQSQKAKAVEDRLILICIIDLLV